MKAYKLKIILLTFTFILTSCGSDSNKKTSIDNFDNSFDAHDKFVELQKKKIVEAEKITKDLCDNFPKDLVLKYNPKGKRIEIEPVNFNSGKLDFCRIILVYGERNNATRGSVTARAPAGPNPLSRIKPVDGYIQKIEGFGDKAFYMNKDFKLTLSKNGLIYDLILPKDGSRTSIRDDLEVLLELATHYKLNN